MSDEHVELDAKTPVVGIVAQPSLDGWTAEIHRSQSRLSSAIDGLGIDMSESQVRTSTTFNELYLKARLINEDDERVRSVTAMMEWLDESGRPLSSMKSRFEKSMMHRFVEEIGWYSALDTSAVETVCPYTGCSGSSSPR